MVGGPREVTGVLGSGCFNLEDLSLILEGDGRSSLLHTKLGGGVGFMTDRIDFSAFFDNIGVIIGGPSSSLV